MKHTPKDWLCFSFNEWSFLGVKRRGLQTTSDGELLGNHSQTWLTVSPHASTGESGRRLTTERLFVGIYRRTIEVAALFRRSSAPHRLKDRRWVNNSIFMSGEPDFEKLKDLLPVVGPAQIPNAF